MSKSNLTRWSGLAAMLGGVLGIVLAPVATSASFVAYGGSPPSWVSPLRPALDALLAFATPAEVYATYGKVFFLVFLLFLAGLAGLRAQVGEDVGQQGKLGFQLAYVGLAMNLAGNITDYWLGEEILHQPLWGASFVMFTLLGLLVYMVGSIFLGLATWRANTLPRWAAGALMLAPPLTIVNSIWGVRHIPSAQVLPQAVAWVLVGYFLWVDKRAGAAQPRPAI